jgi:hypothetical protein
MIIKHMKISNRNTSALVPSPRFRVGAPKARIEGRGFTCHERSRGVPAERPACDRASAPETTHSDCRVACARLFLATSHSPPATGFPANMLPGGERR